MPNLPVFVICRDRLSCLVELVDWLERAGHERIFLVDNDSSYPPLLEYYERTPHHVVRLDKNAGSRAPWSMGVLERYAGTGPYVVTDPDVLPTETCPLDAADHLLDALDRHPSMCKVGLGLVIHDLPDHYALADVVRHHELRYWRTELEPGLWMASVATTFAVYPGPGPFAKSPALRTGAPYVARHLPWYENSAVVTDEERHYREHLSPKSSTWNRDRPILRFDRSTWGLVRRGAYRLARRPPPPST